MTQTNDHMFKLKSIMNGCQKIKAIHNIDAYEIFGLYFYNDERLIYDSKLCHAIKGKNCVDLIQCSKPRISVKNDSGKKRQLYCQMHLNMVSLGTLPKCIISHDEKLLIVQDNNTTELTPTPTTTTTTTTTRQLRYINIDGKVYYVDRNTLSVYDMDMSEIGKYSCDPVTEQHIICEM